jgi:hypothetical protein
MTPNSTPGTGRPLRFLSEEETAAIYATSLANTPKPRPPGQVESGPKIHYTEMPAPPPDSPLAVEWSTFRRELGCLLAEGHEGKHVLIKGDRIVGIWDTFDEAVSEGRRMFPSQPIAVQLIAEWQPVIRSGYRRT